MMFSSFAVASLTTPDRRRVIDVMEHSDSEPATKQAASKADVIFIGEIISIGLPNTKAPGQATYHGVTVKVLQMLKGSLPQQVNVSLARKHVAGKGEDPAPVIGQSYIFFAMNSQPQELTVTKLLPADDSSIANVRRAMQN